MSDEIKWLPIEEFQKLGYLQEANRQFFHPHGLALAITTVTEGGWKLDGDQVRQTADELQAAGLLDRVDEDDLVGQEVRLGKAKRFLDAQHPEGSAYLAGVWDDRADPEGVYFGDGDTSTKAQEPALERQRHALHRAKFFGVDVEGIEPVVAAMARLDIEPIDWVWAKPDGPEGAS